VKKGASDALHGVVETTELVKATGSHFAEFVEPLRRNSRIFGNILGEFADGWIGEWSLENLVGDAQLARETRWRMSLPPRAVATECFQSSPSSSLYAGKATWNMERTGIMSEGGGVWQVAKIGK